MLRRISVRKNVLVSCAAACIAALPAAMACASTTYTTVTANWTGTSGDWTNAADWSTNPAYPNNGTPSNTVYNVDINSGSVTLSGSINVDSVTLGTNPQSLNIGNGAILNLSQPDNAGVQGLFSGRLNISNSTLENAQIKAPASNSGYNSELGFSTLQNVTLASNLDAGNVFNLTVMNSSGNAQGLNLNNQSLTLRGSGGSISFNDATTSANADIPELVDNGTINIVQGGYVIAAKATLNFGSKAVLNIQTSGSAIPSPSYLTGNTINNAGSIVVGPGNVNILQTQPSLYYSLPTLIINPTNFTNQSTGVITVDSGNALQIDSPNFVNDGLIQTSNAAGLTSTGGASISISRSWTNNGTINIGSSDFLIEQAVPTGTGLVNNSGGQVIQNTNAGTINVGSSNVTGVTAALLTPNFTNSGTITAYNGNVLQIGQLQGHIISAEPVISWTNSGTIQTDNANFTGPGIFPSTAQLDFFGNWSNTGSINAGSGNTINLGGTFHPSDVGLASSGTNAIFHPNGATVNFIGTLINTGNNLVFDANSGHWTSSGTIQNGTLAVQNDANGSPYLQGSLILENVTLNSDLTISGRQLTIESDVNGVAGLEANGHTINITDAYTYVSFITSTPGSYVGYSFDGTINLYGQGSAVQGPTAAITFTSSAVINALAAANGSPNEVDFQANYGAINVGSSTVSNAVANIGGQNFGTITAYSGDTAALYTPLNNGTLRALVGGTIHATGNITPITYQFASGSTFDVQLGSAGASGLLSVDGSLTLDSGSIISLSQLAGTTFTTPYDIINYTGTLTGTFTDVTPGYLLDYSHPGEILVTAVPEPATLALFMLGFASLALRQRKNAKRNHAA